MSAKEELCLAGLGTWSCWGGSVTSNAHFIGLVASEASVATFRPPYLLLRPDPPGFEAIHPIPYFYLYI